VIIERPQTLNLQRSGVGDYPLMLEISGERTVRFNPHSFSGVPKERFRTFVLLKRADGRLAGQDFKICYAEPPSTDYQRSEGEISFDHDSVTINVTLLAQGAGAGSVRRDEMVEINGTYRLKQ
jgi:hypothetical protein